jgi:hypothetical protein
VSPEKPADHSLRQRSAFCITVIIMVITQIHDGGSGPSLLAKRCRQQAEHMGEFRSSFMTERVLSCSESDTLFARVSYRDCSGDA